MILSNKLKRYHLRWIKKDQRGTRNPLQSMYALGQQAFRNLCFFSLHFQKSLVIMGRKVGDAKVVEKLCFENCSRDREKLLKWLADLHVLPFTSPCGAWQWELMKIWYGHPQMLSAMSVKLSELILWFLFASVLITCSSEKG